MNPYNIIIGPIASQGGNTTAKRLLEELVQRNVIAWFFETNYGWASSIIEEALSTETIYGEVYWGQEHEMFCMHYEDQVTRWINGPATIVVPDKNGWQNRRSIDQIIYKGNKHCIYEMEHTNNKSQNKMAKIWTPATT